MILLEFLNFRIRGVALNHQINRFPQAWNAIQVVFLQVTGRSPVMFLSRVAFLLDAVNEL